MTCQHCQTWILDDDHRCRRCGRRVRSSANRISPKTYPIAATATAPAYEPEPEASISAHSAAKPQPEAGQQALFSTALAEPRVIPFDSLTTQAERESIRARAAERPRPAPIKTAKVEMGGRPLRGRRSADQRRLDFEGEEQLFTQPQVHIICDAPVAPASLRMEAAGIDCALMGIGCGFLVWLFFFAGGHLSFDKHVLPFFALALMTIPLAYKLLWTFAGRDTIGMRCAGLQLVDFDGNPPSASRRYQRLVGSILSFLAGGIGLVWLLVDEDSLTWHDHISATFPTIIFEN